MKVNVASVLLPAALAVWAGSAFSADWEIVDSTAGETVLVDKNSIHHDGAVLKVWGVKSYRETNYLGDYVYPHKSQVTLYEVDCNTRQLGYAAWSFQAGEVGSGQTVWADKAKEVMYFPPEGGSADDAVLRRVCGTAFAANR